MSSPDEPVLKNALKLSPEDISTLSLNPHPFEIGCPNYSGQYEFVMHPIKEFTIDFPAGQTKTVLDNGSPREVKRKHFLKVKRAPTSNKYSGLG